MDSINKTNININININTSLEEIDEEFINKFSSKLKEINSIITIPKNMKDEEIILTPQVFSSLREFNKSLLSSFSFLILSLSSSESKSKDSSDTLTKDFS